MNFIYVIHLPYWNHLIAFKKLYKNSNKNSNNKRGRARSARPLLLFELLLLFLYSFLKAIRWFQYGKWMT